jgi:hypothetical protein
MWELDTALSEAGIALLWLSCSSEEDFLTVLLAMPTFKLVHNIRIVKKR